MVGGEGGAHDPVPVVREGVGHGSGIATAPSLFNFLTHEESHRPDDLAPHLACGWRLRIPGAEPRVNAGPSMEPESSKVISTKSGNSEGP